MSKTLAKFFRDVAYLVVLVVALSMMFRMISSVRESVRSQRSIIFEKSDGVVLPGNDQIYSEELIVSYAEVICSLRDGIEYNVTLAGNVLKQQFFDPRRFDYRRVEPVNYKKIIYYGSFGEVVSIDYVPIFDID